MAMHNRRCAPGAPAELHAQAHLSPCRAGLLWRSLWGRRLWRCSAAREPVQLPAQAVCK